VLKTVFALAIFFMAFLAGAWTPSIAEEEMVTVSMICLRTSGSLRKGLVSSNDFFDMLYHTI